MPEIQEVFVHNFKTVGSSTEAISVGFQGIDALPGLTEWYNTIVKPSQKKISMDNTKKTTEIITNAINKNNTKINQETQKFVRQVSETMDDLSKKIRDGEEKADKREAERKGYLMQTLKAMAKGVSSTVKEQITLANIFRDIESSGVYVKDGFKSIGKSANKAHLSYEQFSKSIAKLAPTIAKLNGSMGKLSNGVTVFSNSMGALNNKYGLTNDESQAIFENVVESLTPSQLQKMSQEQLNIEIDKTARQMKELSLATGKSVEQIVKETELKKQSIRVQAYGRTHRNALSAMRGAGLSDEWVDYVISGGTKISPEMLMELQNNPLMVGMLKEAMKLNTSGKDWTSEDWRNVSKKYMSRANMKENYASSLGNNVSTRAAMVASSVFEGLANTATVESLQKFMAGGSHLLPEESGDETRNTLLKNQQQIVNSLNQFENALLNLKTGGIDTTAKSLGVFATTTETASKALSGMTEWMQDNLPTWFNGTVAWGMNSFKEMLPMIVTYFMGKGAVPFTDALVGFTKRIIKTGLETSVVGKMFKSLSGVISKVFLVLSIGLKSLWTMVTPIALAAGKLILIYEAFINGLDLIEKGIRGLFGFNTEESWVSKILPGWYASDVGKENHGFTSGFLGSFFGSSEESKSQMVQPSYSTEDNSQYITNNQYMQEYSTFVNDGSMKILSSINSNIMDIKRTMNDYVYYIKTRPNNSTAMVVNAIN